MNHLRNPYGGPNRKLVLAFDVGTTYSGISYSILEPGLEPKVEPVTRFPGQDHVGGDAKIPSIIYYDREGRVKAVGAEASQEHVQEEARENNWFLSKWFKLHLRPKSTITDASKTKASNRIPSLPASKSAEDVFADFLEYLFYCAKKYIIEIIPDSSFWSSVEESIDFVLSHPNGWEGAQQFSMRRAAIEAGLIPDTREGQARVTFVTEGEACLHFCIHNRLSVSPCDSVLIVDAGGGTIDLSTYTVHSGKTSPADKMNLEEITAPQCVFAGSIFVNNRARKYFEEKLSGTRFFDDIDQIIDEFDKKAKLRFKSPNQATYIKFGSFRDNDPSLNIRSGQMALPGTVIEEFFEPSLMSLIDAIEQALSATGNQPIKSMFLVGGFSGSEWLFSKLVHFGSQYSINVCRPKSNLNKATADGAVSFYLDHFVSVRVARWSYGIQCTTEFDAQNTEHLYREHLVTTEPSGTRVVPHVFSCILQKHTRVSETKEFRTTYTRESRMQAALRSLPVEILSYRGDAIKPMWTDVNPDCYQPLCKVKANMRQISKTLPRLYGPNGIYFRLKFDVVLLFGLTELKAQLAWKENGVEKRCPAEIVYDIE
ncbi:hypothetical protein E1B28_007149 [Marasmius oreades]|uniref:Uncharacterized protein n=1 Tax=Marasmius oreades TaxID=181124 RepID=A0A9P7S1N5_9AGAR|nr:uncharacterized protein E1B28_007149 [Marasmius oreades]KAG7093473.1 hypothetical protein E1B28_007149 [Marasmius oreades]